MKKISLGFSNFWGNSGGFTAEYFFRMFPFLKPFYNITVRQDDDVDFMLYSVYGYVQKQAPNAVRVLISGEAGDHFEEGGKMAPGVYELGFYHYGLTCASKNPRKNHAYFPQPLLMLNLYNDGWKSLIRDDSPPPEKTRFCDFIYSNGNSMVRRYFCSLLKHYRWVDCAGAVDRNCNDLVGTGYDGPGYLAKQAFQSKHKFSIAFENNYFPGYTTEKLSDPLVARSVPIYSGNPDVDNLFNPEAFICVDNFDDHLSAIDYIRAVDNSDKLYNLHLNAPPFRNNKIPDQYSDEFYIDFMRGIFG